MGILTDKNSDLMVSLWVYNHNVTFLMIIIGLLVYNWI